MTSTTVKKEKIKIISDSGVKSGSSNGAYLQTILFKYKNENYKISIKSETYSFQSYAELSKWTSESGFKSIITKNPKKDFNIDVSYQRKENVSPNVFQPIIKDLTKIVEAMF